MGTADMAQQEREANKKNRQKTITIKMSKKQRSLNQINVSGPIGSR